MNLSVDKNALVNGVLCKRFFLGRRKKYNNSFSLPGKLVHDSLGMGVYQLAFTGLDIKQADSLNIFSSPLSRN